ncbi:MAG: cupredoxin domain-containing protein [Thermoleophilaceae bacterium]
MKARHLTFPLAVMVTAAMLLAGCGGGSSKSSSGTTPPTTGGASAPATSGGSNAVNISNFKFVPASLNAKAGAAVKVTNSDSTAHTFTADDGKSFDTGNLDPGASKSVTVTKAGSFAYHCTIHPFMHGTLVVK